MLNLHFEVVPVFVGHFLKHVKTGSKELAASRLLTLLALASSAPILLVSWDIVDLKFI